MKKALFKTLFLILAFQLTLNAQQSNLRIRPLVPDASLPCSADETSWWSDIQAAARAVFRSKGGEKETKTFVDLLTEGQQHNYLVPIPDQKAAVISMTEPEYSEAGRMNRISGEIGLKVEFLSTGNIGQVTTMNSLGFGLDQKAANAARKTVFLPAVKDRKFVDYTSEMHMTFSTY